MALPGGFLLRHEAIDDSIVRLAKEELDMDVNLEETERLELLESINGDPRGHIVHLPVKIKSENLTNKVYFGVIPKNTIPYQLKFLEQLGYKIEK